MKNNLLSAAILLIGGAAVAQTTPPTTPVTTQPATTVTAAVAPTPVQTNTPAHLKGLTVETLRPEHSFPALGSYSATGSSTGDVTISLDPANKGIVWVEGLPQGKFKAMMKRAPATYKIPAQQTETGKAVAEGTLFLNPESSELTIITGRAFNDEDPMTALAVDDTKAKSKSKTWQYTGVKAGATAPMAPASTQQ